MLLAKQRISVNFLSVNDFPPLLRKGVDIMLAGSETYCVPMSLVNFLLMTQTSGLTVQNEHNGVVTNNITTSVEQHFTAL